MVIFPDKPVNSCPVHKAPSNRQNGIIMAVGIDGPVKKGLRPFTHLGKPKGRDQPPCITVWISKGKDFSPQILKSVNGTCLIDNQVGLIKRTAPDLGCGQDFKTINIFSGGIGA